MKRYIVCLLVFDYIFPGMISGKEIVSILDSSEKVGGYYGYLNGTPKPHGFWAMAMAESQDVVSWKVLPPLNSSSGGEVGACTRVKHYWDNDNFAFLYSSFQYTS